MVNQLVSDQRNGLDSAAFRARLEQALASGGLKFPVLPEIASRAVLEVDRPGSTAKSLGDLVQADPAMAARILRVANSAAYGGLSEIRDLPRAVSRLGSALVVAIVLGCASKELLKCNQPRLVAMAARARSRSVEEAAFCRLVARSVGGIEPGLAFLGGLLHCVGIPVLVQAAEQLTLAGEAALPADPELAEVLEGLQAAAGGQLLVSWHLSATIVAAVRHQADPAGPGSGQQPFAAILKAGSVFATALHRTCDAAVLAGQLHPLPVLSGVAADAAGLTSFVEEAIEQASELKRVFD